MHLFHRRSRARARTVLTALVALSAGALVLASTLPASAITVNDTPTPVTGNTTYFDGLGQPYGGCGLPQPNLDTQNFIALNVYNTPGDYNFYPRPLPAGDSKTGMWNNGHNCGRWVQVTVSDYCNGINDGAPNQAFCRNGAYVADAYNGATLNMIVADSCGDSNAWCRDDPYHIDLSKPSLNLFQRSNGTTVGDMYPNHYNNRKMTWKFIPAPNYSGDITIGFLQGAQVWWPAISVSHLANGIHGVDYFANGAWTAAQMNGDMGQSFILAGTTSGANSFQIRVRDASDALINGGRVYSFSLPAACGSNCSAAYTQVSYTTSGGPTTTPTATPTSTPTVTPTVTPTSTPTATPTVTPTAGTKTCTATYAVTGQWSGNFQGEVTVRNTSTTPLSTWRVTWTYANGQRVTQLWSGTLGSPGPNVVVTNASYNGTVALNATTSFGFLGSWTGTNPVPAAVSCTAT